MKFGLWMFVDNCNNNELRQGDIVQGMYYPVMLCEHLQLIGTHSDFECPHCAQSISTNEPLNLIAKSSVKHKIKLLDAQLQVFRGLVIVMSQCCDLEPHDGKLEVNSFVISPLVSVEYQIKNNPERYDLFKSNSLTEYVNFFYIPQVRPLPTEYMVDFNRVVSVPRAEYELALRNKLLQMTDEGRVRFKLKLSNHFGRPLDEEREIFQRLVRSNLDDQNG